MKSDLPASPTNKFIAAVNDALGYGLRAERAFTVEDIDNAIGHVTNLLNDAVSLYKMGSFGSATFLAITAMEETAKAEILAFRSFKQDDGRTKGRDPLRDHAKKHRIAVRQTTFMGRLPKLIGEDACKRLQAEAEEGHFIKARERAVYLHLDNADLTSPKDTIKIDRARELLLLALECADDILVGYTNKSHDFGRELEKHIKALSE